NCPSINGVQQKEGSSFNSHNVSMKEVKDEAVVFSADIAGTYPKESRAKHWLRTVTFNKTSNTVRLDEQMELEQFLAPQQLHFVTVHDMAVEKNTHGLLLHQAKVKVAMQFDWAQWDMAVEE